MVALRIGYIVNQYPKVSHSFIRREIQALERKGIPVSRYSISASFDELTDQNDKDEFRKTKFVLTGLYPISFVYGALLLLIKNPLLFFKAFRLCCSSGWRSDRGLVRHIAYFFESCVIAKWCIADDVKHIHAHFGTNSSMVAMVVSALTKIPYSFTIHGPEEFDKPEFLSIRKKIEKSSFVVGISSFGRSQIFRQIPYEVWQKVKVVRCGLDEAFYSDEILPVEENNSNLCCIGRLCEQKGQILLIEAFNQLNIENIDFHLTLVGDGPMRSEIESLIEKYQLTDKVTITGWMSGDQIKQQLQSSRAMVLPSFAEGLPVVIMESMSLCRPVLTTYIAGIPELVIDGENGWLVPAGDKLGLVLAIKRLLNTPLDEINSMGNKARERTLEYHDIDKEVDRLCEYIDVHYT